MKDDAMYDALRAELHEAQFLPGASPRQIADAEAALDVEFPAWLRALYARTNGILGPDGAPYLYALEVTEQFPESLVSWNRFLRDEWRENLSELRQARPDVHWDDVAPNRILVLGRDTGQEQFAIDPRKQCTDVLRFSEEEEERFEVVAKDLVERLRRDRKLHVDFRRLLVGRTPHRTEAPGTPPTRAVDLVFDQLVVAERGTLAPTAGSHVGLHLYRVDVELTGAVAELFSLHLGGRVEVRIATRGGNYPFVMTLAGKPLTRVHTCLVHGLHSTLLRLLQLRDWLFFSRDEAEVARFWTDRAGLPDDDLRRAAAALCAEDDRRRR